MKRIKKTLAERDREDKLRRRKYYVKNRERILAVRKIYREKNKEKIYAQSNRIVCKRYKDDKLFRYNQSFMSALRMSFKKGKPIGAIEDKLGCTWAYFIEYIENQFEPWMNWDNRGNWNKTEENPRGMPRERNTCWDIDHKQCLQSADTIEKASKLHHYKNLRPLCSIENRWPSRK